MSVSEIEDQFLPIMEGVLKVTPLTVVQLAGDASNRRYYRIAGGNQSWVLMVWEPFQDGPNYPFLSVLGHFERSGIQVPSVVAKFPEKGWILLEDLGDLTLERKFWETQNQQNVLPFYEMAIDELTKIHFAATSDKSPCTAFDVEFDVAKLLWEMNYGKSHFLEKLGQVTFTEIENELLTKTFTEICNTLHNQPKIICHRDYHSRNLMLKFNRMRVIDFQDARMGPAQYDLVSLLKDSYVELETSIADRLLAHYFERAKEMGSKMIPTKEFFEIYEIQSIQRCFKACGSFASFYNTRNDTRYIKYLPQTLKSVRASLQKFPRYKDFFDILDAYGFWDRDFRLT